MALPEVLWWYYSLMHILQRLTGVKTQLLLTKPLGLCYRQEGLAKQFEDSLASVLSVLSCVGGMGRVLVGSKRLGGNERAWRRKVWLQC